MQSSPVTAFAAAGTSSVVITIDTPGIIDMTRLAFGAIIPPTSNVNSNDGALADQWNGIDQLIVRSDYNMIVGQGSPVAPLGMFSADRAKNWVKFGTFEVVPGDQVTATVRNFAVTAGVISATVPLWPVSGSGGGIAVNKGAC